MATLDWIWYLDGKQCSHPASLLERFGRRPGTDELPLWERANSVECPIGPDPGSAWLLVERTRFNSLSKSGFHTIKIVNPTESVTLQGYVFIRALSMFGLPGDANSPMLVELQDRRAVVAKSAINKGYNVRIPAPPNPATAANRYYPESLDGQSPWTWPKMVTDIWSMLTDAGAAPTIPAPAIGEKPDGLRFYGGNAWHALHAALSVVGLTTAFDPVADTFSIIRPGADATMAGIVTGLKQRLKRDFDPPTGINAGLVPEKVKFFFPKRDQYHGTERDTPRLKNWEADPVYDKIELPTGVAGAKGTLPFTCDLYALYDSKGQLTNQSELNKRANDVIAAITANVGLDRNIWVAGATSKLVPGKELTNVTWRDYGDSVGQITIAERRIPPSPSSAEQFSCERSPEFDSIKPIDLGRRSHPLYPRLMQVVQVFDEQAQKPQIKPIAGKIGDKDAFLHRGRVRLIKDGLEILEDCFIVVLQKFDELKGDVTLTNKSTAHGRLSGTATRSGEELPLYSVENWSGSGTIAFRMLTDRTRETKAGGLSIGYADAIITDFVGDIPDPIGAKVQIVFVDKRWLEAVKDCEGRADYFSGSGSSSGNGSSAAGDSDGFYIVTESQGLTQGFWFRTLQNRQGTGDQDVLVEIVKNIGHANDDLKREQWQPQQQQVIKVRYIAGSFPHMLTGALGYAQLDNDIDNQTDNSTMRYYAVHSDQMTTRIRYTHPKFCPFTSFAVSGVQAMDFWPFSQRPVGAIRVHDIHGDASMGGVGQAGWDESSLRWVSVKAQKEELYVLIAESEQQQQNGCPVIYKQKMSIGRCIGPEVFLEFEEFDAVLSVEAGWDGCDIVLDYNYTNFCAIRSPFNPREADLDTFTFGTKNVLSDVELVFTDQDAGSGSGTPDCNPQLALNYKTTPALTCPTAQESELENASLVPILQETFVIEIDLGNGCFSYTTGVRYVLGACGEDATTDAECQDYECPTGSGSGSGQ